MYYFFLVNNLLMYVAYCQARDCIPNYPWQMSRDVSIPQTTGVNMSVVVCMHACLDSNLFYRLTIFKGEFVGWTKRTVCSHMPFTCCQTKKKVSKEKARFAVVTIILWFTASAVKCVIITLVCYKKQPLTYPPPRKWLQLEESEITKRMILFRLSGNRNH